MNLPVKSLILEHSATVDIISIFPMNDTAKLVILHADTISATTRVTAPAHLVVRPNTAVWVELEIQQSADWSVNTVIFRVAPKRTLYPILLRK